MQTVSRSNFTTVKTEGAILPADLLQRIADGDLDGLQPEQYHLASNERPNEAINRSWNRCLAVWRSFNEQRRTLDATDTGVSLTRERWLLILFQELGYGRLPFQRRIELDDGTTYPISHLWENTPIHLVSFRQELDRRDLTIKRSPHSLVQEFLNRSDDHLWGFVSNGLTLRLLRDNVSLTRAAYLEFDLETMMTGEVYADFSLLWLMGHQSRVEVGTQPDAPALPGNCWLETWSQEAAAQGTRALDTLRDGVQETIAALGRGFLAHPANTDLRQQLQRGDLSTQDYYRQLLRLVYRLIFLFVAEDRDLLLLPNTDPAARQRYTDYYSVTRLRRLAEARRGGPHPDLYRSLRRIFELLRQGYAPLGLPALGSFLFSERATPALDAIDLANTDLLNAIRALAFTIEGQVRRPVDYKNLGAEELGSVYESLLELHPQLNIAAATFELATAAGSERKTTGSYYTPSSLINSLLDSALEPVVADRLKDQPDPAAAEKALLQIKVVDPACGSGHFLIAAANRLAVHLARLRTGDDEPGPAARREALREIVRHCIHGVDINEMSVELCKVALWMETLDPGKPLGFLDANILCGNSLMGATPALLKQGIPDAAFKPITGDDKAYCREWAKRNQKERDQTMLTLESQPWDRLGDLAAAMAQLDRMGSDTLAEVQAQESTYADLVRSTPYLYSQFWADAWCAAFVWPKKPETDGGFAYPLTEGMFRKIEHNPFDVAPWMREKIERLRDEYQFFHWHLAFPHVFNVPPAGEGADNEQTGWNGGFDVVLGNPPWEKIQIEEQKFFATIDPEIAQASAGRRKKLINSLNKTNPVAFEMYQAAIRGVNGETHFLRSSTQYPLAGRGNISTHSVFLELGLNISNTQSRVGLIVPSSLVTQYTLKELFEEITKSGRLRELYDFENRQKLFPEVDSRLKFCLAIIGSPRTDTSVDYAFYLHSPIDLKVQDRRFSLSYSDLLRISPNTLSCPNFRNQRDAHIFDRMYKNSKVILSESVGENPWGWHSWQMFNETHEASELHEWDADWSTNNVDRFYEAKLIHQFDHRFATYENPFASKDTRTVNLVEKNNPEFLITGRHCLSPLIWQRRIIDEGNDQNWILGFRRIARSTDERTAIFSVLPRCVAGNQVPVVTTGQPSYLMAILLANLNSFAFDFSTRLKIAATDLNHFIIYQLPIITPSQYEAGQGEVFRDEIFKCVIELTYTAWDLQPFAQDCGYHGPPFRWDEERRFLLRCELDAAYFHLYGIARDDVDYIMDTFPIVKRRDEAAHGEYRTKRVILEIYDDMAEAQRTGQPYQTRLNPPPADLRVAHPWDPAFGEPPEPGQEWVEVEYTLATEPPAAVAEAPATYTTAKPSPPPPAAKDSPDAIQQTLTAVMPPSGESRPERLKRAKALGQDQSPLATRELVAFLADEDSSVRWLASSSLVQRAGEDTVSAIAAFLTHAEPERVNRARPEALRILALIADTAEQESVREAAREAMDKHTGNKQ